MRATLPAVPSADHHRLPLSLRIVNRVGQGLARLGIEPGVFEVDALLTRTSAATGLDDFGRDDFLEPLAALCADLRAMGRDLSLLGRVGLVRDIERCLMNRLRTQAVLRRHPEIREQKIVAPIFMIGSPRTGTTMLHNLLVRAPGASGIAMWELLEPAPRVDEPTTEPDPRIRAARKLQAEIERVLPELAAVHPMVWDWPEECLWLFANSFLSDMFLARLPLPGYRELFLRTPWTWAVDEYVEALQVIQWQRRAQPRWILKAPGHCFRIPELAAAFPDALFVRTHRDPRKTIASTCSLFEFGRIPSCTQDPRELGRETLRTWVDVGLARLVEASDQLAEARCFDIDFRELMADPFGLIEAMFGHFGIELGDQTKMRRWLAENPRYGKGRHAYSLARYGISEAEVLARTRGYRARFGAHLEC